jgi:hypothetical protein
MCRHFLRALECSVVGKMGGDPGCPKPWLPSLANSGGGREPANHRLSIRRQQHPD